jgi:hypothetical protein
MKITNPSELSSQLVKWNKSNETPTLYPLVEVTNGVGRIVGSVDAQEGGEWETAGLHGAEIRTGEHEVDFALSI